MSLILPLRQACNDADPAHDSPSDSGRNEDDGERSTCGDDSGGEGARANDDQSDMATVPVTAVTL